MSLLSARVSIAAFYSAQYQGINFVNSVCVTGRGINIPFPVFLSGGVCALFVSPLARRLNFLDRAYHVNRDSVQIAEYMKVVKV